METEDTRRYSMIKRLRKLAFAAAGVVALAGLAIGIVAAQTDEGATPTCGFGHLGPHVEDVAGLLQLTPEELRDRLAGGESPAQVAQAQGVGREELKQFLLDQTEERVAEMVAEGDIDQAFADELLQGPSEGLDEVIDREGLPLCAY